MVQWIQPILQTLGSQVYDAPTTIYEESQHTIDIIRKNHITIRVKHISIPIHYVHEKFVILTIDPVKLKTTIYSAYIGPNISTVTLLDLHYSYIHGSGYHPTKRNHYRRLALNTTRNPTTLHILLKIYNRLSSLLSYMI